MVDLLDCSGSLRALCCFLGYLGYAGSHFTESVRSAEVVDAGGEFFDLDRSNLLGTE